MPKYCGNEDSRPNTNTKMGDSPKGGGPGGKTKYQGHQDLGPKGGGWKGAKDSRPKSGGSMGHGGK